MRSLREERLGERGFNTHGTLMEIVEYNRNVDIWVKFLEYGNLVHTNYEAFCKGNVRNPYDKSVYGVGYLGGGKHKTRANGKDTKMYKTWNHMLERCYSERYQESNPHYIGCTVTEEWHNFSVFAKWFDENYYEVEGENMQLDKDILVKRNRVYSPETCIFAPQLINTLFVKGDKSRGLFPLGVDLHHSTYRARCWDSKGKSIHLGYYNTPKEAFEVYRSYKEKLIKQVANEYKNKIPLKLYNALMSYQVDIND